MNSFLSLSWIVWGAVTTVFVALMIWKSLVSLKEENIVVLDPAEDKQAAEQLLIVKRVERVTAWAKRFGVLSAALLLVAGGIWAYRGYLAFTGGQIP
jgi:hypothetical protein